MPEKRDFTDRFLKSIKPAPAGKRIIIYDGQVPGFGIRVSDRSTDEDKGAFVLVSRFPGSSNPTPRRIGDYPSMTLAKARETARAWREDIQCGVDPREKEAERQRVEARKRKDTFQAVFEAFADDHLTTLRTGAVVKKAVINHVYPVWKDRPVTQIRRADVNELIRTLRKDAPIGANRVLAYLKKFFGWAVDQDIIESSPAAAVKKPSKENTRDRVLTEDEIRAVWLGCETLGAFGAAFRTMLATGQRRGEVAGMTWAEIDPKKKLWTMARERTKADRAHDVPLSELALSIIDARPQLSAAVFSSGRTGRGGSEARISGWGKAKARLDELAAKEMREGKVLHEWHVHDLRRTCATYLAKLGVDRIVISKILNHAEGGVIGIYDRHRYDEQKREALDRWALHLTEIVADRTSSNVVPLVARA